MGWGHAAEMTAMPEYIFFMHDDATTYDPDAWEPYLKTLRQNGVFEGGSEIGGGICMRKSAAAADITDIWLDIFASLPPRLTAPSHS
jgi:hypothetical protein